MLQRSSRPIVFSRLNRGLCTIPRPRNRSLREQTWTQLLREAEDAINEPSRHSYGLVSLVERSVLAHNSLADGLSAHLGGKLKSNTGIDFTRMCKDAFAADPDIVEAASFDLARTLELDPAAGGFLRIYFFFKGFHCVQSARVANHFWKRGHKILASAVQSEMASAFDVDIHPASTWGRGIVMDHAGGCVIGETAVVGNNVYFMHDVTLGATGMEDALDRHPKIRDGAFLAAKSTVLGNIVVGQNALVGAHALVNKPVPDNHIATGIPAKMRPKDDRPTFAPSGYPIEPSAPFSEMGEGM